MTDYIIGVFFGFCLNSLSKNEQDEYIEQRRYLDHKSMIMNGIIKL